MFMLPAVVQELITTLCVLLVFLLLLERLVSRLWTSLWTRRPPVPAPAAAPDAGAGAAPVHAEEEDDEDTIPPPVWLDLYWPAAAAYWRAHRLVGQVVTALPAIVVLGSAIVLGVLLMMGGGSSSSSSSSSTSAEDGGAEPMAGHAPVIRLTPDGVPYQLRTVDVDGLAYRLPVVDCAHYPAGRTVLNQVPATAVSPGALTLYEPGSARARVHQQALEKRQRRILQECLLRPDSLIPFKERALDESDDEVWITRARALAAKRTGVPGAQVHDILIARSGARYYRVVSVAEPRLLSEQAIMAAVRDWHVRFLSQSPRNRDIYPCLCAAHFGLRQSGLFFQYGVKDGRWRLMLGTSVARNIVDIWQPEGTVSHFNFKEYLMRFPAEADAPFNVTRLTHHMAGDVHFIDPAVTLDNAGGHALLDNLLPFWVRDRDGGDGEEETAYLAIVPLTDLPATTERIADVSFACLQHCLAIDNS